MPASLSVVIPTLNAADALPGTAEHLLEGVSSGLIRELVISDGGSTDATLSVARELGARVVEGPPTRGGQIARGTEATNAPWLLLLHADTHLSANWTHAVRAHMKDAHDRAGYFRLRFRATGLTPRVVAGGANFRSRLLGLPYGDQGLLISAELLERIGGVPELPLMEDVALARRLRGRLVLIDAFASTSARRYLEEGWSRRVTRNLLNLALFRLGADPASLARRYASRN